MCRGPSSGARTAGKCGRHLAPLTGAAVTDTPDTHPSMMILKIKVDATKLSFDPTMEELANYLAIRLMQDFAGADYAPRPGFGALTDTHGHQYGGWLLQDGKQPYPEWPT